MGVAQSAALLAGISRSGVTIVAGLVRGLTHEDAARFAFLLATPVILLAGVYKLPDLFGPNGDGVRGQILAGSLDRRGGRLPVRALPRPLVPDPHAHALRHLLPARGRHQPALLRLTPVRGTQLIMSAA